MNFYSLSTQTPVGDFHMIIQREDHKNVLADVVRAAGFGGLNELQSRLEEELKLQSLSEIEGPHLYRNLIAAYFNGDKEALEIIPAKQTGSEFNHKVWRAISKVQHGKTISYKELASAAGHPSAVRAVGTVCGLNRLVLLVPCHRIIRSDGKTGEYLYGSEVKEYLLKMEQTEP